MTTTQQEVQQLKNDIESLKNTLADQIGDTVPNGHSKTIINKEELQRMANSAGREVRTFFSNKQEQLGNAKDVCKDTIKERPFATVAAAFAGGALLTMLLKK